MRIRSRLICAAALIIAAPAALFSQWLDYPTPGVPRTPDGKPNMAGLDPNLHCMPRGAP